MILEVIQVGDERLSTICAPVLNPEDHKELIDNMIETLNDSEKPGLGLAAPQVGETIQLFVMRTNLDSTVTPVMDKPVKVIMNPEILKQSDKKVLYREGCLSVPEKIAVTERSKELKVRYMNENGKSVKEWFKGTDAIVFQHEFAHLYGATILDYGVKIMDAPKPQPKEEPVSNPGFEDVEVESAPEQEA